MSDDTAETPAAGGAEPPTSPTEASEPKRASEPLHVPRWAAGVVAAVVLLGAGFGIGWAAAPGGGHGPGPIVREFPGGPGGRFGGPGLPGGSFNGPSAPGAQTQTFLGVSVQAAPTGQQGAAVASVETGSPADQAGLKAGDVITAVDGNNVTSPAQLAQRIAAHQPGDQVTVTYTRSGTSSQAPVKLGTRPAPNAGSRA